MFVSIDSAYMAHAHAHAENDFFRIAQSFAGLEKSLFVQRIDRQPSSYGRERLFNL